MHARNTQAPVESHHPARTFSDRVAYGITRALRFLADAYFGKRHANRALVLETVAAVPRMVAGALLHLRCLRWMCDDKGWMRTLLDEADNERMHLMTFMEIARPSWVERMMVLFAQALFFILYLLLYLVSSRTAHRLVGYSEEEAVLSYTQYLDEIDAGRIDNIPAPSIAIDYWMLPQDARLRDVVMAVRRDEAAHRDANHAFADRHEPAVRASEARFRSMANALPQIVWIADGEGRAEFFNRQWSRYTGIDYAAGTAADVVAASIHPDDIADTMDGFRHALELGESYNVEHRIRAATGEYRWFLARAEPEMDSTTGRATRWYGACVDIHERRIAEINLAQCDRRKDEFLATLAHELRNPLAPIRTGLAVLEMNPPTESAARTRAVMARQLGHMVRLIDDLLDISRINCNKIELRREVLDLRAVLKEATEASCPAIEARHHRLVLSLPSESIFVNADHTRLVQVFGNLLSNAAKYTPPGGRIDLSAEVVDSRAHVRVRDTGIGIDAGALGSVFDMFSQIPGSTDRSQGGLGIGLSLVKRLVQMHGGSVGADSGGAGEGSTFFVTLPCTRTPAISPVPARPVGRGAAASCALDVLVVDDNVDAAEMMQAVLEAEGHCVRVVHSGVDALREVHASAPAVVILDIGIPGIDGYEVARRIRSASHLARVALVALTGWGSEADRERAFESGFDHHLTKPVDAEKVTALLGSMQNA